MANEWFYVQNGQQAGPVSLEQLQQLLATGGIPAATMVWTEGMPQWTPADQVPGLLQPGHIPAFQTMQPPAPAAGARPTSVTVLAIIGIILASLTLLCGLCGIIAIMFVPEQEFQAQIAHLPRPWLIISSIISFAFAILLLAASISSLQLATWARKAMLAYAILSIIMSIISTFMSFAYADPAQPPALTAGIALGTFVGSLIYPAFVLYFFTRPHVVSAFESSKMAI